MAVCNPIKAQHRGGHLRCIILFHGGDQILDKPMGCQGGIAL